MRFGVSSNDETWYIGEVDATIDPAGNIAANWDQRILTMKSRGTSCAVYHDVNKGQLNFAARYYTPGQTVSRAYGVYTVASGSWVLYFHKKDGSISEIRVPRGPNLAWLAPMVKDEDGQLVETPLKECQTLYYSTCAPSCCAPFRVAPPFAP